MSYEIEQISSTTPKKYRLARFESDISVDANNNMYFYTEDSFVCVGINSTVKIFPIIGVPSFRNISRQPNHSYRSPIVINNSIYHVRCIDKKYILLKTNIDGREIWRYDNDKYHNNTDSHLHSIFISKNEKIYLIYEIEDTTAKKTKYYHTCRNKIVSLSADMKLLWEYPENNEKISNIYYLESEKLVFSVVDHSINYDMGQIEEFKIINENGTFYNSIKIDPFDEKCYLENEIDYIKGNDGNVCISNVGRYWDKRQYPVTFLSGLNKDGNLLFQKSYNFIVSRASFVYSPEYKYVIFPEVNEFPIIQVINLENDLKKTYGSSLKLQLLFYLNRIYENCILLCYYSNQTTTIVCSDYAQNMLWTFDIKGYIDDIELRGDYLYVIRNSFAKIYKLTSR
ncbi:MAG: hypothetical protein FWD71_19390 [Oscillospiraceae bacterium]|nr:hypothetical protein [Oscillospiraceae bacterium]